MQKNGQNFLKNTKKWSKNAKNTKIGQKIQRI